MYETLTAKKLATAVLDWAAVDDIVAEKGWDATVQRDGETRDADYVWDELKNKMCRLANELLDE